MKPARGGGAGIKNDRIQIMQDATTMRFILKPSSDRVPGRL
jgi:hypothetical protein